MRALLHSTAALAGAATVLQVVARVEGAFPSAVSALIDASVDPCEDFYQYACGAWVEATDIPSNESSVAYSFSAIQARNDLIVQDIVADEWPLVGELYDSCMDADARNQLGNEPIRDWMAKIQGATSTQELFHVAGSIFPTGPSFLTDMNAGRDAQNASVRVLHATAASLTLPHPSYYLDDDLFRDIEPAFRKYISTALSLAGYSTGCDNSTVEDAIISIEVQLAQMQDNASALIGDDASASYNPLRLGDAMDAFPWSIGQYIDGMGLLSAPNMDEDSVVVFESLDYYDAIEEWLDHTELESLQMYLALQAVHSVDKYLSDAFYDAQFDFLSAVYGDGMDQSPPEEICAIRAIGLLTDLVGKYFDAKMFDEKSEEDAKLMVDLIEVAMADRLEEADWLDDATYHEAVAKLDKVINFVGYESQNESYPYVLSRDTFFANREKIVRHSHDEAIKLIGQTVPRESTLLDVTLANAYYSPDTNAMMFPTGILQAPMYNRSSHPAQNFGSLGFVIGHELTHGFDNTGRQFDGEGNQRDWWTTATADEFEARAKCLADQYSSFEVFEEGGASLGFVDGDRTLGENIADNGGLSLAYDAYHAYMKDAAAATDMAAQEADKLFYVSFAQSWCEVRRDASMQLVLTDAHAPHQWRVNGVVMNSDDFSRSFQCSADAKMNPADKCVLW